MTKQTMWMAGAGIAAVSVLATAMVLAPTQKSAETAEHISKAEVPKPSLMSRLISPRRQMMTVPEGTALSVRLDQGLSTEKNSSGDSFSASLDAPLVINGKLVAPSGSQVTGRLTEVVDSGRVEGRAKMTMVLNEIEVDGKSFDISTTPRFFEAQATKKRDAGVIAGSAAVGAAIGAIAGGGKGAAIGAGVGGGAGTGAVLATKGKPVAFRPETQIRFMLNSPVQMPVAKSATS